MPGADASLSQGLKAMPILYEGVLSNEMWEVKQTISRSVLSNFSRDVPILSSFINWPEAKDLAKHSGGLGYSRVISWKELGSLSVQSLSNV